MTWRPRFRPIRPFAFLSSCRPPGTDTLNIYGALACFDRHRASRSCTVLRGLFLGASIFFAPRLRAHGPSSLFFSVTVSLTPQKTPAPFPPSPAFLLILAQSCHLPPARRPRSKFFFVPPGSFLRRCALFFFKGILMPKCCTVAAVCRPILPQLQDFSDVQGLTFDMD